MPMKFDVFLDTGVSVTVPDGTDPDSDEGYVVIKQAARAEFLRILSEGFDVDYEQEDSD